MIKAIIKGMLGLLVYLVDIFLTPINNIINYFIPNINDYLSTINSFFNLCSNVLGFVVDSFFLYPETVTLLITYITARLLAPLAVGAIKTVVKWWEALV